MTKLTPVPRADSALTPDARAYANALGTVLRSARTARGITRRELTGRLLIGTATLQRMESGDPRVSLGYYLAMGLDLGIPILAIQISPLSGAPAAPGRVSRARASRKRPKDDWFT